MRSWKQIKQQVRNRLSNSPRLRTVMLYLFFVLISGAFWCYLNFSDDMQAPIKVPLEIVMSDDVHIINRVPDTLTVNVKDKGFSFAAYWFKKVPTLRLNLADYADGNSMFKVDQNQLKKLVTQLLDRETGTVVSVLPENITAKYTDLPGKRVPVKMDVSIEPRYDYTLCGAMELSEDTVLVYSDAKTLSEITEVYSYHIEEKGLTDTLRRKVALAPITGAVIEPRSIDIMVPIERLERQTRKVNIDVRNAPAGVKVLLFPGEVEVSFRSPHSLVKNNASNITVVVDYNALDLSGNEAPVIVGEMPAAYRDVQLDPDSVEFKIEKSQR